MSELCERCGWPKMVQHAPDWRERCWWNFPADGDSQTACLLRGYEREQSRADRYQAEFAACKALLIAEQKRAERAEAERAEAEQKESRMRSVLLDGVQAHDCAGQGECWCDDAWPLVGLPWGRVDLARRALAELARCSDQPALPNEPPSPTGDAE